MTIDKPELQSGRRILLEEDSIPIGEELKTARRIDAPATLEVAPELNVVDISPVYQPPRRRWLKRLFFVTLTGAMGYEALDTVLGGWQVSPLLGTLYGLAIASGLVLLGGILWREFRALRNLKRNQLQRNEAERLLSSEQVGEAMPWLEKLNAVRPVAGFDGFREKVKGHFSDREIMQLYRDTLLSSQDERAQRLIKRYAVESGLLVALSPLAVVDMLAVLWRGTRLIEKISALYGLRLSYVSRIRLYRMLAKQMLFVGATELVSDLAATALGAELIGKLSARAAQGISAGILTARIGQQAMALSRPLPMLENRASLLRDVSQSLLGRLVVRKEQKEEQL